jgi:hypothetical protein
VVENPIHIEVAADFTGSQAMELITHRSPTQQIGSAAVHLAGARSTEGEVNASILVQPVGFIEQLRNLLHFIDNDLTYGLAGRELGPEQFRVLKIPPKFLSLDLSTRHPDKPQPTAWSCLSAVVPKGRMSPYQALEGAVNA